MKRSPVSSLKMVGLVLVDLAEQLIKTLRPGTKIEFTGLLPGADEAGRGNGDLWITRTAVRELRMMCPV